jgi:hypothetical protein
LPQRSGLSLLVEILDFLLRRHPVRFLKDFRLRSSLELHAIELFLNGVLPFRMIMQEEVDEGK